MKKLLLAIFLNLVVGVTLGFSQDEPKVCLSQTAINKCASAVAELLEARTVITEFQKERSTSVAEREAAAKVIAGLNDLVIVKDRVIATYEQINALYKQTVEIQSQIIDKLEKRLLKGKSGFERFLDVLKTVGYILAGAALGRGL